MSWDPNQQQNPNAQPPYSGYGGYTPPSSSPDNYGAGGPQPGNPYNPPQQEAYGQTQYQQPGQQPGQPYGQQPGRPYQQPGQPYQQPGQPYGQPGQPYGQQQYQQPGGFQQQQFGAFQQPFGSTASPDAMGPTSMGMSANVAAGLSYIVGIITGLIFFLLEKQNRFVRFNAMQSILLAVPGILLNILVRVLPGFIAFPLGILSGIVSIVVLVFWIICMVNAFQGKYYKVPIIGDYAEKFVNTGSFT